MPHPASAPDAAEYTTPEGFHVRRMAGALGAEVRGLSLESIDAGGAEAVLGLLIEHHVLFFPEQAPSVDAHIAFGRCFGELEGHPHLVNRTEGLPPEIFELSAKHGGVAKFPGSGGAVVGTCDEGQLDAIRKAYEAESFVFVVLKPHFPAASPGAALVEAAN